MRKKYLLFALFAGITFVSVAQNTCQKAKMTFESGKYEEAIKYYNMCRVDFGTDVSADIGKATQCRDLLIRADGYFDDKDYVKAAEKYRELRNLNPSDLHAKERYKVCAEINSLRKSDDNTISNTEINPPFNDSYTIPQPINPNKIKFRFGIVGGLSVSNIESDSWIYDKDRSSRLGFAGGMLFEFQLTRHFSIQPELLFVMKGAAGEAYTSDRYYDTETGDNLSNVHVTDSMRINYLELPLNLVLNIPVSENAGFFVGAGYYFAYGVYGKLRFTPSKERYSFDEDKEQVFSGPDKILNPFDHGINCMVGIRFGGMSAGQYTNDLGFLRAGYEWSLNNMAANQGAGMATFKNTCFYIQTGFRF